MNYLKQLISRICSSANSESDSGQLKQYKFSIFLLSILLAGAAFVWGISCLILGLYTHALVPFTFFVLTISNLLIFRKAKSYHFAKNFQLIISFTLPCVFQLMLGGINASGVVIIWALIPLIGLLTMQAAKDTYSWYVFFVLIGSVTLLFDNYFSHLKPDLLTPQISTILLILNFAFVSFILFTIARYFIHKEHTTKSEVQSQLRAISNTVPMFEINAKGNIIKANQIFKKLTNITEEDMLNTTFYSLIASNAELFQQKIKELKDGSSIQDTPQQIELSISTKTNALIWFFCSYTPIYDDDDELLKVLILAKDISEIKESAKLITEAYEELQTKNQMLSDAAEFMDLKNAEISQKKDLLVSQNKELEIQRELLGEQNKKMVSSIQYAQRIQNAMLGSQEILSDLFSDGFILLRPKDIVSGDFYWVLKEGHKTFIACADCTGHGVPGAFMSLIGMVLLNKIIVQYKIADPHKILETLHHEIQELLKQKETQNNDGMDIALCMVDSNTKEFTFSGAHRPLFYIHKDNLEEIQTLKGIRAGLGGYQQADVIEFENHTFPLSDLHRVYLCSDGMQDQFGVDEKGRSRRFGLSRIRKALEGSSSQPVGAQKEALIDVFEEYRGENKQIDDILFIGLQVSSS